MRYQNYQLRYAAHLPAITLMMINSFPAAFNKEGVDQCEYHVPRVLTHHHSPAYEHKAGPIWALGMLKPLSGEVDNCHMPASKLKVFGLPLCGDINKMSQHVSQQGQPAGASWKRGWQGSWCIAVQAA